MNKIYTRINWQNEPSLFTPINETNLNAMDYAINEIDSRVVSLDTDKSSKAELNTAKTELNNELERLDTVKAEQSDLLNTVNNVAYDPSTGTFTFTFYNGTVVVADLNIEKIPVSFSMSADGVITMETTDGTKYTADIASIIKEYQFEDSGTIEYQVRVDENGNKHVKSDIIEGSITGDKLEPNYLANVTIQANNAKTSEDNAKISELNAAESERKAGISEMNALTSETNAKASEVKAKEYMEEAKQTDVSTLSETIVNQAELGFLSANLVDYEPTTVTLHKTNSRTFRLYLKNKVGLKSGKEYTISIDDLVTSNVTKKVGCNLVKEDGTNLVALDIDINDKKVTFNATEDISIINLYFYLKSNDTDNAQATFSKIMFNEGTEAIKYVPYALSNVSLSKAIAENKNNGFLDSENLYNPSTREENKYLDDAGITVYSDLTFTSEYIPIQGDIDIVYSYKRNNTAYLNRVHAYDSSKNWISMLLKESETNLGEKKYLLKTPSNCAYIRFANSKGSSDIVLKEYIPSNKTLSDEIATVFGAPKLVKKANGQTLEYVCEHAHSYILIISHPSNGYGLYLVNGHNTLGITYQAIFENNKIVISNSGNNITVSSTMAQWMRLYDLGSIL